MQRLLPGRLHAIKDRAGQVIGEGVVSPTQLLQRPDFGAKGTGSGYNVSIARGITGVSMGHGFYLAWLVSGPAGVSSARWAAKWVAIGYPFIGLQRKDGSVKRMPEKRIKDRQITFRATPRFYEAVIRTARLDTRSVNSLIEKLLRDHMHSVGIDPDEPPSQKK